jgi:predicted nuclease with TOPRIM domain
MQKEQTEYAKRFEKFGLERGHENSKDRHISQKQYRRVINRLNKSLDVKYIKVEKPSLLSSYKNYQRDLQKKVDSLADQALAYKMRAELAEEKVNSKAYEEIKKLRGENADLIEETENRFGRISDLRDKNEELEKQNESLKAENKEYRMELKRYGKKQEKKKGLSHP